MDKNAKQMRAGQARQDELTLNKVFCWFGGGVVLEFLLLLLNRYYTHYTVAQINLRVALGTAIKILAVACLAWAAAAGVHWRRARDKGFRTGKWILFTMFPLGVSVSCFATWLFGSTGLRLMYTGLPVIIVLATIYYLYQREFFLIGCLSIFGLLGIWISARGLGSMYTPLIYGYAAGVSLLILAATLVCWRAQRKDGVFTLFGKTFHLFAPETNYGMLYLSAVFLIGIVIAAALGVGSVILYCATVAWILIMAVYYTVKLM